jgi:hypothetical protein
MLYFCMNAGTVHQGKRMGDMKKERYRKSIAVLLVLGICAGSSAQIYLNGFYSRAVKDRRSVATSVDSLQIETLVKNGIAHTTATFVVRPHAYYQYRYEYDEVDGRRVYIPVPTDTKPQYLDSIEITAGFQLPTDFIAKNLYLWINGKRETAHIQDKTLAAAQYQETVGERIDPALLQFWGNGRYDLRVFPAESEKSRKFAIEFEHSFDDDSGALITAALPFVFDSSGALYRQTAADEEWVVKHVRVTVKAGDSKTYTFSMEGVGAGTFSAGAPLEVEADNVSVMHSGVIAATDPSGAREFCWTGIDQETDETRFGFSTLLSESNIVLEPEPDTRIIVVDMREEMWDIDDYYRQMYEARDESYHPYYENAEPVNIWRRAQKFAVLCIQNYVDENQKFNIVFAGKTPRAVFDSPVSPTDENLSRAYQAIRAESPDTAAQTAPALQEAVVQAPKGIVILISDLYRPYDYLVPDKTTSKQSYVVSDEGKAYTAQLESIADIVDESDITLFTIADEYQLTRIAYSSGGYNLASLRSLYYYRPYYLGADGSDDEKITAMLPRLFLDNYYNRGFQNITVEAPRGVEDVVYTVDNPMIYRVFGGGGGVMVEDAVAAPPPSMDTVVTDESGGSLRKMIVPGSTGKNTAMIRLAAGQKSSAIIAQNYIFEVSGKLGGLHFTTQLRADVSLPANPSSSVQWAFRKTEYLANEDFSQHRTAIKQIGIDYHIVTRMTSLLALEDWMTLWEDTLSSSSAEQLTSSGENRMSAASQDEAGGGSMAPPAKSDSTAGSGGTTIDDFSIDEIINASLPATPHIRSIAPAGLQKFGARLTPSYIVLTLPSGLDATMLNVSVFDLQGRRLVRRVIDRNELSAEGRVMVQRNEAVRKNGTYIVRIGMGERTETVKLSVMR